jgi:hypothetical protein
MRLISSASHPPKTGHDGGNALALRTLLSDEIVATNMCTVYK